MKTAKLNDYQKRALKDFEDAYIHLIDSGVSLIAFQPDDRLVGLYAYSCWDMEEPIEIEKYPWRYKLKERGYTNIMGDLEEISFFDVEAVINEYGYQPYAKFKEEE